METAGFRVRDFVDRLAPGAVPWLGDTELSLRGRFTSEGLRNVKAEFAGGVPALTLRRGSRFRTVRVSSFKGSAEWMEKGLNATLSDLSIDDPRTRLSGELSVNRQTPSVEARLEGQGADIPSIRAAILALVGDVPDVRVVLGVVRGGTLSRFSLNAGGTSAGDLADLRTLQARATLTGGTITIPGIDLTLGNVGGEASLSGGILTGRGLSARLGNSRVREGTLRMGIAGGDAPFHAELPVDADLGELQPLLRRLVPDERFRDEIDRIHGVRGTASGLLTLGERLSSIRPTVALTSVDLAGKYDRVPFPITIRGGEVSYDGASFSVTDLRGSLGGSTVSGLTGRVDLGKTPAISIRGGTARIALGEVYPWIASLDGIRETVTPVRSVQGVAGIATLSCDGPLREPGRVEVRGRRKRGEPGGGYPPAARARHDPSRAIPHPPGRVVLHGRRGVPSRHDVPGRGAAARVHEGDRPGRRIPSRLRRGRNGEVGVRAPRGPASVRSQGTFHRDRLDALLGKGRRRLRGCDACVARWGRHRALPPENPGEHDGRPDRDTGQGVGRENGPSTSTQGRRT